MRAQSSPRGRLIKCGHYFSRKQLRELSEELLGLAPDEGNNGRGLGPPFNHFEGKAQVTVSDGDLCSGLFCIFDAPQNLWSESRGS